MELEYNLIRNLVKEKNSNIDNNSLTYIINYFYVLIKKNIIPQGIKLDDLIDNMFKCVNKIEFYDQNHKIYEQFGSDIKGVILPETKTIYINNYLPEPLREMVIYHELHHTAQTNIENNAIGINQKSNIGRLIMEAQTQYFCEEVYKEIHGVNFKERHIISKNLRMIEGGTVISKLHNYEMYDNLLTKIGILLGVNKDFFVSINFLTTNNQGLVLLKEKFNIAKNKYSLPYDFEQFIYMLDYIYCVDYMAYIDNEDKQNILKGKTTNIYQIYPDKIARLSLKEQKYMLDKIDSCCFLSLLANNGNYKEFSKYIINDEFRNIIIKHINNSKFKLQPKILKKIKL